MSGDVVGICITILGSILIGSIAIAIAVFFGLRSTVNPLGDKLSTLKDDLITELSNIRERIVRIEDTAGNIWQFMSVYFQQREGTGTVVRNLKNFGETRISAKPASGYTLYTINIARGKLDGTSIDKISKMTDLESKENELFSGQVVQVHSIGSNILTVQLPSIDPKLCTNYMSIFLKWLDTTYVETVEAEIKQFEDNITV